MDIRIYQINSGKDAAHVAFGSIERLQQLQGSTDINESLYDMIFEGAVECKTMEDVYQKFNTDHPKGYRGHSLSVSDIVEIKDAPAIQPGFYFCDSFGFKKVVFKPPESEKNTIKVVLVESGKLAKEAFIGISLEDMQVIVGGCIEQFCPYDELVAIICDEEGKCNGKDLNRAVYDEDGQMMDIISGTFFVCSIPQNSENFESLSDEQVKRFIEKFRYPERFHRVGDEIKAVRYNPTQHKIYER